MTVHAGPNRGAGGVNHGFSNFEYHVRICAAAPSQDARRVDVWDESNAHSRREDLSG